MNSQFFGGPVDGGTFPALIWGTYMKQAVGKYCGGFPKPKTPFASQPFMGHYATTGRKSDDTKDGAPSAPGTAPQGTQGDTQSGGADKGNGGGKKSPPTNGGTTYNPDQYESPPQGAPGATGGQTPPGQ
jgi:penicillin-binding protein 1A